MADLYLLINKLDFHYPHIYDKIVYFFIDMEKIILNNQIINIVNDVYNPKYKLSIQLANYNYKDNNLRLLYYGLSFSSITYLYLSNNSLKSISLLCKKLKTTNIKELYLCNNKIKDIDTIKCLSITPLEKFHINNNLISDFTPLSNLLKSSKLKKINIANNCNPIIDDLVNNIKYSNLEYLFSNQSYLRDISNINNINNKNNKKCKISLYVNYP